MSTVVSTFRSSTGLLNPRSLMGVAGGVATTYPVWSQAAMLVLPAHHGDSFE